MNFLSWLLRPYRRWQGRREMSLAWSREQERRDQRNQFESICWKWPVRK